jgi:DDE superfamily endonuclease
MYPAVLEELLPAAWHRTDRYAKNRVEADHDRLKARLRPRRGLKQDRSARAVIAGHAREIIGQSTAAQAGLLVVAWRCRRSPALTYLDRAAAVGGDVGSRHRCGPAVSPPPQGSTNRCPEFNQHSTQDLAGLLSVSPVTSPQCSTAQFCILGGLPAKTAT